MIVTAYVTGLSERENWQAELLEWSWLRAGQPGELLRLVACGKDDPLPIHLLTRVVRLPSWADHPYLSDSYPEYDRPAALLRWLLTEPVDGTIVLIDPETVFLEALPDEVPPGHPIGHRWREMPSGDGIFGLPDYYRNLQAFCVNRKLRPPRVRAPVSIQSNDLRKIAARWLELTGIVRSEVQDHLGRPAEACDAAFALASAEYGLCFSLGKRINATSDRRLDRPLLSYAEAVESSRGEIIWDSQAYQPWQEVEPSRARAGAGRQFLQMMEEFVALRTSGDWLRSYRPRHALGVREARILDRMLLEIPRRSEPLHLNSSAAAIWEMCDGERSLGDITDVLQERYEAPREFLIPDIDRAIRQLQYDGAIRIGIQR